MVPRSEGVYHANLVVVVGPLAGWRHIAVTEQRTEADCAKELRYLADEAYPDAESNRLWQDTLAAYSLAVLYEVFPPAKACRRARRFAVHSTPKHGTGLTMDEIESSAFEPGCPSLPVSDFVRLHTGVDALERERTTARRTFQWRFTSHRARVTLSDLYLVNETQVD